ncbi:uncharacterized BrkB/YihY/UPF0761 family membrane protein [Actinoplanes tereljensis]|uniref:Uncharacterized protein n=1 Tax=Paractinoplanes tereljensis TaxID=571912 RepID=A0A919TSD1_9ACTN|nr:YhjD/YihY/BrkB family envelope integrity protein [Actinoplanes tereljensis]GIF21258.1 hypothetical protein Ate02nite_39880 [Actinoplanes tereljensis]
MVTWADRRQRRNGGWAFAWAVLRKYLDDDGPRQAALITYYGFLSLFPLLLLGVAVVSRVLEASPDLRHRLIVAIVPAALQDTVDSAAALLPTSPVAFVLGAAGLLYSATGVVFAAYRTVNHLAAVPVRELPGIVGCYLRVGAALLLLLAGVICAGGLTVLVSAIPGIAGVSASDRILAVFGTLGTAFLVLLLGARVLLCRPASWRSLWPAAVSGAAILTLILHAGGPLLTYLVRKAGPVYGAFATVAGLFTLLYLASQAMVICAEMAAVRHAHLWPRSLDPAHPTDADARALALLAREQERVPLQRITSELRKDPDQEQKDPD